MPELAEVEITRRGTVILHRGLSARLRPAASVRDGPYHVVRTFTGTGWPSALRLPRPVARAYRVIAAPAIDTAPLLTGPRR